MGKYAENILTTVGCFALTKSGEITSCTSVSCGYCQFYGNGDCRSAILNWMYSEYKKPKPKLTLRDKAFLDEIECNAFIARDENEALYMYLFYPEKGKELSEWNTADNGDHIQLNTGLFPFIKWEDEKPRTIEDLKKLEVEGEESYDKSAYVR